VTVFNALPKVNQYLNSLCLGVKNIMNKDDVAVALLKKSMQEHENMKNEIAQCKSRIGYGRRYG